MGSGVTKYKLKYNTEILDVLFLKDEFVYISESIYVMNRRYGYAHKVFNSDRKYLGMIHSKTFEELNKNRLETIYT